jgi:hypothetical protein
MTTSTDRGILCARVGEDWGWELIMNYHGVNPNSTRDEWG